MSNHINEMAWAYQQVQQKQQALNEGKLADKLRAMNAEKKKRWDAEGEKAKKDAFDAMDKVKANQARMDKGMSEGYKNIDRKTGAMSKKAAIQGQEAGFRRMAGKSQREGGLRNAVRKAVGLKPKSRPEREMPGNKEKEAKAKSRAAKMVSVIDKHMPGSAQDKEKANRDRGAQKYAKNNIRKLTREDYYLAVARLMSDEF